MDKLTCPKCNKYKLKNPSECVTCKIKLCSKICLQEHINSLHTKSIETILESLNKKSTETKSIFLIDGTLIKEFKPHSIYNFKNFEYMKIGKRLNVIGNGAFGEVILAKNIISNILYAVKQV